MPNAFIPNPLRIPFVPMGTKNTLTRLFTSFSVLPLSQRERRAPNTLIHNPFRIPLVPTGTKEHLNTLIHRPFRIPFVPMGTKGRLNTLIYRPFRIPFVPTGTKNPPAIATHRHPGSEVSPPTKRWDATAPAPYRYADGPKRDFLPPPQQQDEIIRTFVSD